MLYFAASLAALATGPVLSSVLEKTPRARTVMEWAVTLGLLALLVAHVLPEAIELAQLWVFPVAAASVLATLALEKWAGMKAGTSAVVLGLGMLALGFHSMLDGAALAGAEGPGGGRGLAIAVVLHRLPTSMAIWWVVTRALSARWAVAVITWDGLTTIAGFFGGAAFFSVASPMAVGLLQAVIAGSLLHVAFHVRGHGHGHGHRAPAARVGVP